MKQIAVFFRGQNIECIARYDSGQVKRWDYVPKTIEEAIGAGQLILVKTRETSIVKGYWYERG